jgi:hypothetical protein
MVMIRAFATNIPEIIKERYSFKHLQHVERNPWSKVVNAIYPKVFV